MKDQTIMEMLADNGIIKTISEHDIEEIKQTVALKDFLKKLQNPIDK